MKRSAEDVEDMVCKLAKKGLTPSQIGIVLRDQHGVGRVKNVTGKKIVRILRTNGILKFMCVYNTCVYRTCT